ncbi:hypothetical protein ACIGB8_26950 [Promicromonospora sukumoe]|uniref:hypothetical protein n=1 Tax=Promicromonospora sukumoe TaxID=88382 RepID=UPI0037C7798E
MTDNFTPDRDVSADPDVALLELTAFELITLLSQGTTEAGRRTTEMLRLPDVPQDSPLLGAGLSSLVVRRLARTEDGALVPVGKLAALSNVLFTADTWVEAAGITDRENNAALLIGSLHGSVVVEPRPNGIWQVLPLESSEPVRVAASRYVQAAFRTLEGRPFGGSVKVTDAKGARTAAVRVAADDTWQLVHGPVDQKLEPAPVRPDPTFRILAEAVA